jgi:hypothetical protein
VAYDHKEQGAPSVECGVRALMCCQAIGVSRGESSTAEHGKLLCYMITWSINLTPDTKSLIKIPDKKETKLVSLANYP